ncbi:MAG: hypothetical protein HFG54_05580 [Lachnospiraceae bacterium]|jgi:hypothetical protein|nr:hypothetical protein [Lachnospiraceae bacterium]
MSNVTKDDIFKIHDFLMDSFVNNEQAQELMKKGNFTTAQIQLTSLMITEALRQYHTLLTGEILP